MSSFPGLTQQQAGVLGRCAPRRLTIYTTGVDYCGSGWMVNEYVSSGYPRAWGQGDLTWGPGPSLANDAFSVEFSSNIIWRAYLLPDIM